MRPEDVLKSPLVSEKMTGLTEKRNAYGFVVDRDANKLEIKNAVEKMYGVHVTKVRTMVIPGKNKFRNTKKGVLQGRTQAFKKAVVTLNKDEKIDFFSNN